MQITGEQLHFLIQTLKDSLEIQMGYDWSFKHKRDKRQEFFDKFIQKLLAEQVVDVREIEK